MARVPQVTRTIMTTEAEVLCINLETQESFIQKVKLPRTYKDNKAMLKKVESVVNSDTVKAVHIRDFSVYETLYGMSEDEFIANASVLPPRNIEK